MPPRHHKLLTKEMLEDLYFQQHRSMSGIAQDLNVPYSVVRDSFRVHGLVWRTKSEARKGRAWDSETKEKISKARTGYKDSPEIAERKRATLASVCNWTKDVPVDDPRRVRQREAAAAAMKRPEVREALSKLRVQQIQAGGFYDRGYHESPKIGRVYYMSGWELRRWKELDADPTVVSYLRSPCWIPYEWEGGRHRYVPDVLIQYSDGLKVLEEIKPESLLVKPHKGQAKLLAKVEAGRLYAMAQGWVWRVFGYPGR
jgi:hypothetical protein